jgi:hypothetical protein
MMSIRLSVTIVVATLFWPVSSLTAEQKARLSTLGCSLHPDPTRLAARFRRAPVGHRQPRLNSMSDPVQGSAVDVALRRLDEEIDRKLIICRGC